MLFSLLRRPFLQPAGLLLAAGCALLLPGCAPGQDEPAPAGGRLDPRRYLAVGDSHTAGLRDGGLSRQSQEFSFPNLLARQLPGEGAAFTQPLLAEGRPTDYLRLLRLEADGTARTERVPGAGVRQRLPFANSCGQPAEAQLLERAAAAGLPQNLGVPGLRLSQIENTGYGAEASARTQPGAFNPYFERLLPAAAPISYRRAVTKASGRATFFTFFLGLDEYADYVGGGAACPLLPANLSGSTGVTATLTTPLALNARRLLDTLSAGGRTGVVALLPSLRDLPVLRQGLADTLQARLRRRRREPALMLWIFDNKFRDSRQIDKNDFVLPAGLARLGEPEMVAGVARPYGLDPLNPLRNADVLDFTEFNNLTTSLTAYNEQLKAVAEIYKLATVELGSEFFAPVAERLAVGGVVYSAEPVRGKVFSLDGYSLTPRGNALLANGFVRAINRHYGATLPLLDVNSLPAQ